MKKNIFILLILCLVAGLILWQQVKIQQAQQQNDGAWEKVVKYPEQKEESTTSTVEETQPEEIVTPIEDTISINDNEVKVGHITLRRTDGKKISELDEAEFKSMKQALVDNKDILENFSTIVISNFKQACKDVAKTPATYSKCFHAFKAYLSKSCEKANDQSDRIRCFAKPDINKFKEEYKDKP